MGLSDITREAVLAAIDEHDRREEQPFLEKYGFGRARSYWLKHDSKLYSSKAIVGVAHQYLGAGYGPLQASEFTGGRASVEALLNKLGFSVRVDGLGEQTSEGLIEGQVYTRAQLKADFGISDATINNGIFHPKDTASVWLFVTEEKANDRTQYADRLDGDILYMQGQNAGRTDRLIIEHAVLGLELLVFHRRSRHEHAGAGFAYLGAFDYQTHEGPVPTDFILKRRLDLASRLAEHSATPFDPINIADARKRIMRSIAERRGQGSFRNALLAAYGGSCAISGCAIPDVLEAAHIHPYRGDQTNHIANGLLLRADLHTLFDLGLIAVEPLSRMVVVAARLKGTEYGELAKRELRKPLSQAAEPSCDALRMHYEQRTI